MTDISTPSSSLWTFAVEVYSQPAISTACLGLQDQHDINVNLLLWCLWMGAKGYALSDLEIRNAEKTISSFDQQYVKPLRQLRRRMKIEFGDQHADTNRVRDAIKSAELAAEKQVLTLLEGLGTTLCHQQPPHRAQAMGDVLPRANIQRYLVLHRIDHVALAAPLLDWQSAQTTSAPASVN